MAEFTPSSSTPVSGDVGFQPDSTVPLSPDESAFANAGDELSKYLAGDPTKEAYTQEDRTNLENLRAQGKPIQQRATERVAELVPKLWDKATNWFNGGGLGKLYYGSADAVHDYFTKPMDESDPEGVTKLPEDAQVQEPGDALSEMGDGKIGQTVKGVANTSAAGLQAFAPEATAFALTAANTLGEYSWETSPVTAPIAAASRAIAPQVVNKVQAYNRGLVDYFQRQGAKDVKKIADDAGVPEDSLLFQVNKNLPYFFIGGPELGMNEAIATGIKNSLNIANRTLSGAKVVAGITAPYAATAARAATIDKILHAVGLSSGTTGIDEILAFLGATKGGTKLANPELVNKVWKALSGQTLKDTIEIGKAGFLQGGNGGVNEAVARMLDQKALSLQETATAQLKNLTPEEQTIVNDLKSDGDFLHPSEDLGPDLAKVRDKVKELQDIKAKSAAFRKQSKLGMAIEDLTHYVGGMAATTAFGAGVGTAFEGLQSPTGEPLTGSGTALGGALGLAYAPFGAAAGMVDARITNGGKILLERGAGKIPNDVLQRLNPQQRDFAIKYAGMFDALGRKMSVVSPEELISIRNASRAARGQAPLPADAKPGWGMVDEHGNAHINQNALQSASHEFTHATQQFFAETLRKLAPEYMKEFDAQYGEAAKKAGSPSFDSAAERDAEIGGLVLKHTPVEYFVGGERPYDVIKRTLDGLLARNGVKTIAGFEAPYTSSDVASIKSRMFRAGEMATKPIAEAPHLSMKDFMDGSLEFPPDQQARIHQRFQELQDQGAKPEDAFQQAVEQEFQVRGTPIESKMMPEADIPAPMDAWLSKDGDWTKVPFGSMHEEVAKKLAGTDPNTIEHGPSVAAWKAGYARIAHNPRMKEIMVHMPRELGQLSRAQEKNIVDQAIFHDYNRVVLDKGFESPELGKIIYDKKDWDMMPEPVKKVEDLKASDLVSVAGQTKVIKGVAGGRMLFADGSSQPFDPDVKVFRWNAKGYVHPSERTEGSEPTRDQLAVQRQATLTNVKRELANTKQMSTITPERLNEMMGMTEDQLSNDLFDRGHRPQLMPEAEWDKATPQDQRHINDFMGLSPKSAGKKFSDLSPQDQKKLNTWYTAKGFKENLMPERSQAWMDESGNEVPMEAGQPHSDAARKIIGVKRYTSPDQVTPEQELYQRGMTALVSYPGEDALYLRKPGGNVTPSQIASAIETAKEKGYKRVFLDTGGRRVTETNHPIWTSEDRMMPESKDDYFKGFIDRIAEENKANEPEPLSKGQVYGWIGQKADYHKVPFMGHKQWAREFLKNPSADYEDMYGKGYIRLESFPGEKVLHVDRDAMGLPEDNPEIKPSVLKKIRQLAEDGGYRSIWDDVTGRQIWSGNESLMPEYGYMGEANTENARGMKIYPGDIRTHSIMGYGKEGNTWRYNPETRKVYWHNYLPSLEARESADAWLKGRGEDPVQHTVIETADRNRFDQNFKDAHLRGRLQFPNASFGDRFMPETKMGKDLAGKGYDFNINKKGAWRHALVVTKEGEKFPAAWLDFHVNDQHKAHIEMINVKPAFQNQGVGEAMYRELGNYLQKIGVNSLDGSIISPTAEKLRAKVFPGSHFEREHFRGSMSDHFTVADSPIPPRGAYQFMPQPDNPDSISRTAIRRDSDGKVFAAKTNPHEYHESIPSEYPELADFGTMGGEGRYTRGYVTGNGEFLDKSQGFKRMLSLDQIPKGFKEEYKGELQANEAGKLMPEVNAPKQWTANDWEKNGKPSSLIVSPDGHIYDTGIYEHRLVNSAIGRERPNEKRARAIVKDGQLQIEKYPSIGLNNRDMQKLNDLALEMGLKGAVRTDYYADRNGPSRTQVARGFQYMPEVGSPNGYVGHVDSDFNAKATRGNLALISHENTDHSSAPYNKQWRYRDDNHTAYWWSKPEQDSKDAVEHYLRGKGENVIQHKVLMLGQEPEGRDYMASHHLMPEPITKEEARGNSRAITPFAFESLQKQGSDYLNDMYASGHRTMEGLDSNDMLNKAWGATRKPWGGVTINPETGRDIALTGRPSTTKSVKGATGITGGPYAMSGKLFNQKAITVPIDASQKEFNSAIKEAVKEFPQLEAKDHYLGVFRDEDRGQIEIDPVIVVDTPHKVEAIGAYTRATGGAYDYSTGNGYFPPHVDEAIAKGRTGSQGVFDTATAKGGQPLEDIASELGVPKDKRFYEQTQEAQDKIRKRFMGSGEAQYMPEWLPKNVRKHITPDEETILDNTANSFNRFMRIWSNKPTEATGASYAKMGAEGKQWYDDIAKTFVDVFRQDANRFAAVTASFSPRTPVEPNIEMALSTWDSWLKAGRPTDATEIKKAVIDGIANAAERMGEQGTPMTQAVGLSTYLKNITRALQAEDASPSKLQLSGSKVGSYAKNLSIDPDALREVTNDSHIAQYISQDPKSNTDIFGKLERKGIRTKTPEYIATSAHIRMVADRLTKITGEKWTPRQAQAAIWSYILKKQGRGPGRGATPSAKATVTGDIPSYGPAMKRYQTIDEPF